MYRRCCVVNCDSRRKDVTLYKFPKSEIGLKKWLECINSDILRSLSFERLRRHYVCSKHFEKRFRTASRLKCRLRYDAYPTLFSDKEIASGTPEASSQATGYPRKITDHDYSRKRIHCDHSYCKTMPKEKLLRTDIDYYTTDRYYDLRPRKLGIRLMPSGWDQKIKLLGGKGNLLTLLSRMKVINGLILHKCVYFNCYMYIIWAVCNGLFLYCKKDLMMIPKLLVGMAYFTMITTFAIKLYLVHCRNFISDISKLTWMFLLTILIQIPIVSFFLISIPLLLCTPVEICLHGLLLPMTLFESTITFLAVLEVVKHASIRSPPCPQYFSTIEIKP